MSTLEFVIQQNLTFTLWVLGVMSVLLLIAYPFILWDRAYRKKHPIEDDRQT